MFYLNWLRLFWFVVWNWLGLVFVLVKVGCCWKNRKFVCVIFMSWCLVGLGLIGINLKRCRCFILRVVRVLKLGWVVICWVLRLKVRLWKCVVFKKVNL